MTMHPYNDALGPLEVEPQAAAAAAAAAAAVATAASGTCGGGSRAEQVRCHLSPMVSREEEDGCVVRILDASYGTVAPSASLCSSLDELHAPRTQMYFLATDATRSTTNGLLYVLDQT